jgi:hypothetical protein
VVCVAQTERQTPTNNILHQARSLFKAEPAIVALILLNVLSAGHKPHHSPGTKKGPADSLSCRSLPKLA